MNSKKPYLPKVRCDYHPVSLNSTSPNGLPTIISPVTDPVVCNNIAWQEGDYTEDMADDDTP